MEEEMEIQEDDGTPIADNDDDVDEKFDGDLGLEDKDEDEL